MAAKKMKKMKKMAEASDSCECSCCDSDTSKIESWFLIMLGAVGLLMALGMVNFGTWNVYFDYAFSTMAILIGMMMLMKNGDGCC